ncbi:MAG: hypothetical protein J2P47_01095 [Acetobacteraceae bacterium]|nr:hypothetical protein [Acetobacteraceae bacterium]
MPVCEADPWRLQYFAGIPCPAHVRVPTEDADAWVWYPDHRWIYDKLAVALSQGLSAAPHGVMPAAFPVFSKPIINLRGMGAGSRVIANSEDYAAALTAGHFWCDLLEGDHISTDMALVSGAVRWWRHTTGETAAGGTFDYWQVEADPRPVLERYLGDWTVRNLRGYTGMANVETIGGRIIEAHLRFADQWPDLYGGRDWVEAVIRLYETGRWRYDDAARRDGYSVVLFGPHDRDYRHPPAALVTEIARTKGVSSIQITFHEDKPGEHHSMPPGGFRLAIVNAWSLEAGVAARRQLEAALIG